jgi:hypothetical protein
VQPTKTHTAPNFRVLPLVTDENEHFWRGGADGQLHLLACDDCGEYIHPPAPVCGACLARESHVVAVSGKATLLTYTENHQPWIPGFEPPYIVAIVELAEQTGLRLTTNLVNVAIEDVRIGMPLRVLFEPRDDEIFLPLFEPDPEAS